MRGRLYSRMWGRSPLRYWAIYLLWVSVWLGVVALSTTAHGAGFQPLTDIQASAEQHLRSLLSGNDQAGDSKALFIKSEELDNRLRLAMCPVALEAFLPSGANIGSRVTTGVRCTQGTQWTVYVPVNVESELPVLVTNKALLRNASVGKQDVDIKTQRVPGVGNANLKTIAELSSKTLKRDLPAGTVLAPAMFQPEILIHHGQQVTLLATVAGIEVRAQGVALTDGVASSRIRVKNLNSAKVVEGLVDSSSTVRIEL